MDAQIVDILKSELGSIREQGLYKDERIITTPQAPDIKLKDGREVVNFCANNYLGLSSHPDVIAAARKALDTHGYGMSSVRFICGTQDIHKKLEKTISKFFGKEDAILYSSCFDANTGLFETLLNDQDAIISDELNHASIIDGVRLCKAERRRYKNADMTDLETQLKETQGKRLRMIATDGAFSMDGTLAPLDKITALAEQYKAIVMIDDSHSTGFMGKTGRGTGEHWGVLDKIDIITSTMGKAMGGASGGFTTGKKEVVDFLRNRSRPYLFSNSLAPSIVAASYSSFGRPSKKHFRMNMDMPLASPG
ncbi:MAG: glycine C-acetyltransferase, partial [Planctomycetota bacterium]|nr:glycine C-acetyltransferase [Planctomycetota bacterium]